MWERRTHVMKVFVIAIFLLPNSVFAANDHVVISEVQITGGIGATDQDFIELYNPTNQPVDLTGYRLVKRTATGTTDTTIKSWTSSVVIPAGEYFLWANTNFLQPGVIPNETNSGTLSDNNSIALRRGDANTGDIIDSLGWGSATGVLVRINAFETNPGAKQSLERRLGSEDTGDNSKDFFLQTTPNPTSTKTAAVITPQTTEATTSQPSTLPAISAGSLLINEVFPAPSSGSEWVELVNTTANSIDLSGVTLEDGVGPILSLSGQMPGNSLKAFDLSSAKINNDGDRVRILLSGIELDAVSYGKWNDGNLSDNAASIKTNQAVARKSSALSTGNNAQDFAMTEEPTKGFPNIILQREVAAGGISSRTIKTNPSAVMRINELMIDPGDGDTEWIELYNAGETSVDLAGWTIEDGSGAKTTLVGTWIPGQFFVVKDVPGVLNNTGDVVVLRDDKGEVHDRVSYGSWDDGNRVDNALRAMDPQSIGRRSDGYDTGVDSKDFIALNATKGDTNTKGVPPDMITIPDGAVVISEINPLQHLPFAELSNTTDSYIRLSGWSLKDDEEHQINLSNIVIAPHGFFAVPLDEYTLKQKGYVALYDQKRHQKDKIMYRGAAVGKSFAMVSGDWLWVTPSPDRENKVDVVVAEMPTPNTAPTKQVVVEVVSTKPKTPKPSTVKTTASKSQPIRPLVSLERITDKMVGKVLRTSGMVSEKKGNIATIKDGDHSFRVSLAAVNYRKENIVPGIGDKVVVTGQVRKSNAGLRIVPRTLAEITLEKPPPPTKVEPVVEMVIPVEKPRSFPWPAIFVALGSILVSLLIKGAISLEKMKGCLVRVVHRLRVWRAPK